MVDVITGRGDLELVTRIYICGDMVRWVGRGVLALSEAERSLALSEHFSAVDAAAPASKVAGLVTALSVVERVRAGLWVLAGIGGSLAPLMVVLWGTPRLDGTRGVRSCRPCHAVAAGRSVVVSMPRSVVVDVPDSTCVG